MTASGYGVYFEGDENVLELDNTDVSKPWQYIKNHLIIYFEMVFWVSELRYTIKLFIKNTLCVSHFQHFMETTLSVKLHGLSSCSLSRLGYSYYKKLLLSSVLRLSIGQVVSAESPVCTATLLTFIYQLSEAVKSSLDLSFPVTGWTECHG